MLNPIVTAISGQVTSPFAGGVPKRSVTQKHRPLVWECMLGTVYARDPIGAVGSKNEGVEYFDYHYAEAHRHARVKECTDLRICRTKYQYSGYPRKGQWALWGIPPAKKE